jgi:hypothetical protein
MRLDGGDRTCFESLQRVGCDPEAGQTKGLGGQPFTHDIIGHKESIGFDSLASLGIRNI